MSLCPALALWEPVELLYPLLAVRCTPLSQVVTEAAQDLEAIVVSALVVIVEVVERGLDERLSVEKEAVQLPKR
jgi:hypothetical protein